MPSAPRSLEQHVDVETPEQVLFSYTVAGVGSRAAAAIVDLAICFGGFLLLLLLVFVARAALGFGGDVDGGWMMIVLIFAQFAILWGYYVLF